VVYNMMRLAEFLLRWTGEAQYADYWERNLVNGILAQQNPVTGMVAYYLPMRSGSVKRWGSPKRDFWCCHGTLVQAHTIHAEHIFYATTAGLALAQWIPSTATWQTGSVPVTLTLSADAQTGQPRRPNSQAFVLKVDCAAPAEFTLSLRIPWWVQVKARVMLNGQPLEIQAQPGGYAVIQHEWHQDTLRVEFPKALTTCPLPDAPGTLAFMDGAAVLAGIYPSGAANNSVLEEVSLVGDAAQPETLFTPDTEREWGEWRAGYRTMGQAVNLRFIPLNEVVDERYGVYFPVKPKYP
jgi:hypothetical protein